MLSLQIIYNARYLFLFVKLIPLKTNDANNNRKVRYVYTEKNIRLRLFKYLREQTTRFYRGTSLLTEMVMTAKSRWDIGSFVGSITEEHFRAWVTIKKSTYREVSLRYHAQFWSLHRNTRIMQITRALLLCSHAFSLLKRYLSLGSLTTSRRTCVCRVGCGPEGAA